MASFCMTTKHCHTPGIDLESNLFFEFLAFAQSAIVLGCQYLNIYKTVWWLPHSTTNYALNFHLIDVNLSGLLIVVMSRRFVSCFYKECCRQKSSVGSIVYYFMFAVRCTSVVSAVVAFVYFGFQVASHYSPFNCLFLFYPLITYVILFRFDLQPLFGKLSVKQCNHFRSKSRDGKELPVHICTASPEEIREEVENLKTDFNGRITQILFNSMLCTYYMACIPLCFAQNNLHYDAWWVGQYIILVWMGMLVLFANHFFPIKYLDVFHRCSLHLGRWSKIEARIAPHMSHVAWSELQLFPHGSTVKHVKGLFRADGASNAAEPGNSMHSRFYYMFQKPLRMTNGILLFAIFLVFYEFVNLLQTTYWNNMLTLVFLLFPNYFVLYKVLRNRFVIEKVYRNV